MLGPHDEPRSPKPQASPQNRAPLPKRPPHSCAYQTFCSAQTTPTAPKASFPGAQALPGQEAPAKTLSELQGQLDAFRHYYNHIRPHRALGRRTPLQAHSARTKARPAGATVGTYFRVREDKVDKAGKVSLRYDSRLYKIGLGRAHKGRVVRLLIADLSVRVIDANGELIRELTLDPSRCYQPLGSRSRVRDVPTHVSGMS